MAARMAATTTRMTARVATVATVAAIATVACADGAREDAGGEGRVEEYARRVLGWQMARGVACAVLARARARAWVRTGFAVMCAVEAYGVWGTACVVWAAWGARAWARATYGEARRRSRRAGAFAGVCVGFIVIDALERRRTYAWMFLSASGRLNVTTFNVFKAARYDALRLWSYVLEGAGDESMFKVLRYVFYPPLRVSGPLLRFREFERHRNRSMWRVVTSCVEIVDACAWLAMSRLARRSYYGAYDIDTINSSALHAVLFAWTHTTMIWMSSMVVFTIPHALALIEGQVSTRDVALDWRSAGTSFSHFWRTFHASLNDAFVAYIYDPLGGSTFAMFAVMAFSFLFHGFDIAWVKFFAINAAGLAFERALKSYHTSRVVPTAAYQTALFMLFTRCTMPITITPAFCAINFLLFCYFHQHDASRSTPL